MSTNILDRHLGEVWHQCPIQRNNKQGLFFGKKKNQTIASIGTTIVQHALERRRRLKLTRTLTALTNDSEDSGYRDDDCQRTKAIEERYQINFPIAGASCTISQNPIFGFSLSNEGLAYNLLPLQ